MHLPKLIGERYVELIEETTNGFAQQLIRKGKDFGINDDVEQMDTATRAVQQLYSEARSDIQSHPNWDATLKQLIIDALYESQAGLTDRLARTIRLGELAFDDESHGSQIQFAQIIGSQVGNLIQGSVKQSQISTSLTQLGQQGADKKKLRPY